EFLEMMDEVEEEKDQQALFERVKGLLERIGYFEEQQKISKIRFRLRNLDTLLGEVDFLGMDEELARNVEPVRRVIERSLKQENHRLSVDRQFSDSHLSPLRHNRGFSLSMLSQIQSDQTRVCHRSFGVQ
ncbi:MAG: hypothetical protein ABFS37_09970, partial [Acidobacteriota bacterium]